MRVSVAVHPSFAEHSTGQSHPERPGRLQAVLEGVEQAPVEVVPFEPHQVDQALLNDIHRPEYVDSIRSFCRAGGGALDPDTVVGPASWEAALRAAGAGPAAVDLLDAGTAEVAFLPIRPPGHHALKDRAMGFCLFNNVAITARMLTRRGQRVAVVDWDVHHGNGTQETFLMDPQVLYVSLHEFPAYPGTGWIDELGLGPAYGTSVNFPFPTGTAGDVYRASFERVVVPILRGFAPDWLLVSCGYDAHRADPLAGLALLESDYAAMASFLRDAVPSGRTVVFLEGGYDLEALRGSAAATLSGLAGLEMADEAVRPSSGSRAWRTVDFVIEALRARWELV